MVPTWWLFEAFGAGLIAGALWGASRMARFIRERYTR